ncbi:hypothetical protein OROGR_011883 [Orobanche gracilis]
MEVVSEDGSKTQIKTGQTRELGRANGLNSSDKTISRRHLSFFIPRVTNDQEIFLQFEVLGRNPVYVSKDNEVKIFRRFERGEMEDGNLFCASAQKPVWYTLRKIETCGEDVRRNDLENELAGDSESMSGFKGAEDLPHEGVHISHVDPVKEFGFVVMGHEFDSYHNKKIRDIKNWDWFLEGAKKDSEDDDDDDDDCTKRNKSARRKRKKGTQNDDEDWTGESEDDKVLIDKSRKAQRPKYTTRSKDRAKLSGKDPSKNKSSKGKEIRELEDEEDEDEDENDETLGGFIVDDEKLEVEEEIDDEENEEEEELADDFDEDE